MFYSLIMLNNCLFAIAKNVDLLINEKTLIQFLIPWYRIEKHHLAILAYLESTFPSNNNKISRIEQKTALKAVQAFKKVNFLNNLVITKTTKIIALKDQ